MSERDNVVSLAEHRSAKQNAVQAWTADEHADMRTWVSWDYGGRAVTVSASPGDAVPDVSLRMSPEQARTLGLALIGAATLAGCSPFGGDP